MCRSNDKSLRAVPSTLSQGEPFCEWGEAGLSFLRLMFNHTSQRGIFLVVPAGYAKRGFGIPIHVLSLTRPTEYTARESSQNTILFCFYFRVYHTRVHTITRATARRLQLSPYRVISLFIPYGVQSFHFKK